MRRSLRPTTDHVEDDVFFSGAWSVLFDSAPRDADLVSGLSEIEPWQCTNCASCRFKEKRRPEEGKATTLTAMTTATVTTTATRRMSLRRRRSPTSPTPS